MERLERIISQSSIDTVSFGETVVERVDWLKEGDFDWLIQQAEEFERYKKYVEYFAGKDKVNDIRIAMEDRELD